MSCSTVSNAAERSSNTNITHSPSSIARRMSLCIRVNPVSVLWPFLYADWKISCRLASLRWWLSRTATTFSVALEMKLRFEIGLKFLYTSWSRESFLSMGSTTASLKAVGTNAVLKDRLTMSVLTVAGFHNTLSLRWPESGLKRTTSKT